MAINIKEILADSLLALCEEKPLKNVTVKDLLDATGVSRQSFYNHFLDKNDLIQYIYLHRIIPDFDLENLPVEMDFRAGLLAALRQMERYRTFLKQALLLDGQNNLKDFLFAHCAAFDLAWHQKRYGKAPMPDALRFATQYHANASSSMTVSWVLSDMPVPCEQMADLITELRSVGMEQLFADGETKGNPYKK